MYFSFLPLPIGVSDSLLVGEAESAKLLYPCVI